MNYSTKTSYWPVNLLAALVLLTIGCGESREPEDLADERYTSSDQQIVTNEEEPIVEAVSLFGHGLVRPDFDTLSAAIMQQELRDAVEKYDGTPESMIWIARKTAALWRYQDAVVVLTDAIEEFPEEAVLYRYRGQYLFFLREFDIAADDFSKAARYAQNKPDFIETDTPDGQVIEPSSSFLFNLNLFTGLNEYARGRFRQALEFFEKASSHAANNDTRLTALDWQVMALVKLGHYDLADHKAARALELEPVTDATAYRDRLKLLVQSEDAITSDDGSDVFSQVTLDYGRAMAYRRKGDIAQAERKLRELLDTNIWAAVSYIMAEADLKRTQSARS